VTGRSRKPLTDEEGIAAVKGILLGFLLAGLFFWLPVFLVTLLVLLP
jgi:hypothetical protein